MNDEPDSPDFAMARAVEILANIYERQHKTLETPPPPADRPIVLFNEELSLDVTTTTRADTERALGIGFAYPARGWHTYCVRGSGGERQFLSCFYSGERLASAELYLPKSERAPKLASRNLRFRLVPGEIALGANVTSLPEHFGRMASAAEQLGAFANIFEARFPGGAAYAMGNGGVIERLAIYVLT